MVSGSFFLFVSGSIIACNPAMNVTDPKMKIGRIGSMYDREAMKGAAIEPSLAIEQANDNATDRTTVGNNSVVYRYTIPQHTWDIYLPVMARTTIGHS